MEHAIVVGLALMLGACTPNWRVGRGMSAYDEKEYKDAIEHFDMADEDFHEGKLDDKAELRLAAYRGLSHYELYKESEDRGDRRSALKYLRMARRKLDKAEPDWLEPPITKAVEDALADLGAAGPDAPDAWE
jgi:hypothetical protein